MAGNKSYILCTQYNNHPKEDLAFCKRCELNDSCQIFQVYMQPPWVKEEARHESKVRTDVKIARTEKPTAICDKCRHYYGDLRCEAFPEKVPTEIKLGYVSHIRPYAGDQGIRFEPIDPREGKHRGKRLKE